MTEHDAEVTLNSLDRKIDISIGRLATWLDGVDKRFDQAAARLEGADKRFDGADRRLDDVGKQVQGVDKRFDDVDARLDRLDAKIDAKTDEAKRHALVLFEATKSELRQVVETVSSMNEKLDRPLNRDGRGDSDIEFLRIAVRGLDRRVSRLEDASEH